MRNARKRIYAIHILDTPPGDEEFAPDVRAVYFYRKTRDERTSSKPPYNTRRGDWLTSAMQAAGYEAGPFLEAIWKAGRGGAALGFEELKSGYFKAGVKFEIPGRFNNLDSFDHLEPSAYAREQGRWRRQRIEDEERRQRLNDEFGDDWYDW